MPNLMGSFHIDAFAIGRLSSLYTSSLKTPSVSSADGVFPESCIMRHDEVKKTKPLRLPL